MHLRGAANYFSITQPDGWVSSTNTWVSKAFPCTLLPMDRFVSEREFGLKRRYMLVHPDYTPPYSAIRFGDNGPVYLVGWCTIDYQVSSYSKVILLHEANLLAQLITRTVTATSSGMGRASTETVLGTYPFSIERVTAASFREFQGAQLTDFFGMLPRDCPVSVDNEIHVGTIEYQIQEVFASSGFTGVRVLSKKP